jgi:hypothetical protein
MYGSEEDVDRVVKVLPNVGFGCVHSLLQISVGLENWRSIVGQFCQQSFEVAGLGSTATFGHQLHELGVGLVAHAEKRHHLETVQFRFGQTCTKGIKSYSAVLYKILIIKTMFDIFFISFGTYLQKKIYNTLTYISPHTH